MSRIVSFSTDNEFAERLDEMVVNSGYKNRSMFLREASINFYEKNLRGELNHMSPDILIEGTAVVYFQHDVEHKLSEIRHSGTVTVSSYHHNCLPNSHSCVDIMQVSGLSGSVKQMVSDLRNINQVDRVEFVIAPDRDEGCC
tara:strand:+ start:600 stop:1025 length:426 start_codon:yes stop_codon:yes gene_type:complete